MQIVPVSDEASVHEIARLARLIWPDYYAPLIGAAQVEYMLAQFQSREAVAAQIREGSLYYLLREDAGGSAGYFALVPREREMFLSKLYIVSARRGRGYGRMAVEFAAGQARTRRLPKIALTVNRRNAPSIAAYGKLGFVLAGSVVAEIGAGFVMDDFQMERSVE